ncbi:MULTISPECIES: histidine phosphatase family protein [Methylobacterium]|uniref:histidine phosphatase family protein n=1 Tax=Methylobacterium TaxID=407 RepID=UPI003756B653
MPGVTLGREEWAQETAGPVAARMGLPVPILPALNEIDFGAWAGQDFATPWTAIPSGRAGTGPATSPGRPAARRAHAHTLGLGAEALQRFEAGPASVSVLVVGDWGAKIESLNERAFLKDPPSATRACSPTCAIRCSPST